MVFLSNSCNMLLRITGWTISFEHPLKAASLEHNEHEESQHENNGKYQVLLLEKMGALSGQGEAEA